MMVVGILIRSIRMVSEITEPIMDNYTQACWCLRENDGWKRNDSWEIDKPRTCL